MRTALGPPRSSTGSRSRWPSCPARMDGTRLAVVSDIHLGPLTGTHHTGRIVDLINSVDADIVCVVGDLVDGSVAELGAVRRAAGRHPVAARRLLRHRQPRVLLGLPAVGRRGGAARRAAAAQRAAWRLGRVSTWPASTTSAATQYGDAPGLRPGAGRPGPGPAGGADGAPAVAAARGGPVRRRPAGLRAHPRRSDGAVQPAGQAAAAGRVRARPGGRRPGLRDQRRRFLGSAGPGRRAAAGHP